MIRSRRSSVRHLARCVPLDSGSEEAEDAIEWAAAQDPEVLVTVGVDTHRDLHVAVALDQHGRWLGMRTVPTMPAGFAALVAWAGSHGVLGQIGIGGTGSYGAGLAR